MFLTTKTYPGGLLHDPSTFYTEKRRDSKHYQTSANRLIGAVLMDLHDEWIYSSRKYINFDK